MDLIDTNIGKMPVEDYIHIQAVQYGYDSYDDMKKDGLHIEIDKSIIIHIDTDE